MPDTSLLPTFITDFVSNVSSEQRRALISLLKEYEDCVGPYLTEDEDSCSNTEAKPSHPISAISKSTNQISQHVFHVKQLPMSSDLSEGVLNELASMKLRTKGKKGQTAKVKRNGSYLAIRASMISRILRKLVTTIVYPKFWRLLIITVPLLVI